MNIFFRYPHTAHLAWLGKELPRDDKVLSHLEATRLLNEDVIVEEKLDGANLGISLTEDGDLSFQNRGQYLAAPFTGQFSRLTGWAMEHKSSLMEVLTPEIILFGEWLTARHSIGYDRLPDWFVAFDVYDFVEGGFWSAKRRDALAKACGVSVAPCLFSGRTTLTDLQVMATESCSAFGSTALEGLVIRHDGAQLNEWRVKLVRPDFTQAIDQHWRRRALEWNRTL
jgi:ATP-dependent RNA circularization protein (DNA/RNA ligase family)